MNLVDVSGKPIEKAAVDPVDLSALDSRQWSRVSSHGGGYLGSGRVLEPFAGAWQRNIEYSREDILCHPIVFACITLIASDISKLAVNVVREDSDGIKTNIRGSKWSPFLKRPNPYQTIIEFIEYWMISLMAAGNTYVLKIRDARGDVVAGHVLDPWRVTPRVAENGEVYYQLRTDELSGVPDDGVLVPASEVFHDKIHCLYHPLVGIPPLYAAGHPAALGLSIQSSSKKFFENNANPGGILTAPAKITDATAARLKAHFEAGYSRDNAGKVAVLGDGLKFEPMAFTPKDSLPTDQDDASSIKICSAFKMPPHMVGLGNLTPGVNAEQVILDYYNKCLQRPMENAEAVLTHGLGMPDGVSVEFDVNGLQRMDMASRIKVSVDGVRGGVYTPNEGRRRLNLPGLEGGDTVYLQHQDYPIEQVFNRDDLTAESERPQDSDQTMRSVYSRVREQLIIQRSVAETI